MTEFKKRLETWKSLQAFELQAYRESYKKRGDYYGYFSIDSRRDAKTIGKRIAASCDTCLDVGAGILPCPVYMDDSVKFMGIDPFFGEYKRVFPFAQAIGEHLPFPDTSFECVSFMSTLDHQIEPLISLREAHRVLVKDGLLFLWVVLHQKNSRRYRRWRNSPFGTKFNQHHQHAFIRRDIEELFEQADFEWLSCERISRTYLIIGKKYDPTLSTHPC